MITVIQPRWEIDEKARILRVCVWFRPIHPPSAAEMRARVVSTGGFNEGETMKRMVSGGSFITVDSRRAVVREEPWRTSGNQKWKGAKPSFMAMAVVSRRQEVGWVSWVRSH